MSKREPKRRNNPATPPPTAADEAREAHEAPTGRPGDTAPGAGNGGGHTAKRQQTGVGREEQIRPHQRRAAEEG